MFDSFQKENTKFPNLITQNPQIFQQIPDFSHNFANINSNTDQQDFQFLKPEGIQFQRKHQKIDIPEELVFYMIDKKYIYQLNNEFRARNVRIHLDKYKMKITGQDYESINLLTEQLNAEYLNKLKFQIIAEGYEDYIYEKCFNNRKTQLFKKYDPFFALYTYTQFHEKAEEIKNKKTYCGASLAHDRISQNGKSPKYCVLFYSFRESNFIDNFSKIFQEILVEELQNYENQLKIEQKFLDDLEKFTQKSRSDYNPKDLHLLYDQNTSYAYDGIENQYSKFESGDIKNKEIQEQISSKYGNCKARYFNNNNIQKQKNFQFNYNKVRYGDNIYIDSLEFLYLQFLNVFEAFEAKFFKHALRVRYDEIDCCIIMSGKCQNQNLEDARGSMVEFLNNLVIKFVFFETFQAEIVDCVVDKYENDCDVMVISQNQCREYSQNCEFLRGFLHHKQKSGKQFVILGCKKQKFGHLYFDIFQQVNQKIQEFEQQQKENIIGSQIKSYIREINHVQYQVFQKHEFMNKIQQGFPFEVFMSYIPKNTLCQTESYEYIKENKIEDVNKIPLKRGNHFKIIKYYIEINLYNIKENGVNSVQVQREFEMEKLDYLIKGLYQEKIQSQILQKRIYVGKDLKLSKEARKSVINKNWKQIVESYPRHLVMNFKFVNQGNKKVFLQFLLLPNRIQGQKSHFQKFCEKQQIDIINNNKSLSDSQYKFNQFGELIVSKQIDQKQEIGNSNLNQQLQQQQQQFFDEQIQGNMDQSSKIQQDGNDDVLEEFFQGDEGFQENGDYKYECDMDIKEHKC